jgi:hypothetical protein
MTDSDRAGLDPAHVISICGQATGGRQSLAVKTRAGITVCLPSRRAASQARAALAQVGYQVTTAHAGSTRDLIVSGWDPARLDSRLAAMRNILHQLASSPAVTARAVIEHFRDVPAATPSPEVGSELLEQARTGLRGWVTARSGIHAPRDPASEPADAGVALRLRAATVMEEAIGDLTERHLRAAGQALVLFCSLRQRMDDNGAQAKAVRWANVTFQLSGSPAQDSTPLLRAMDRFRGSGASPASRPVTRLPTRPALLAGRESGGPITSITPGPDTPVSTPGPTGPRFPADRPRHRR